MRSARSVRGVSSILTKSIIQHKFYINIRIEITHNILIISPDFMVASFINEICFKTYTIVQYSPEKRCLMGPVILDDRKS